MQSNFVAVEQPQDSKNTVFANHHMEFALSKREYYIKIPQQENKETKQNGKNH